ncbi:hypothetical protein [Roseicella frigidaeris]|uniref:Uncharacterized protein n=1 Tax=Roseicella frigidaeris TaxID=2230885 RepID=A0A327M5U5_9PROT|nr:hypothetical protein [Roseicella frigidaeris]RAI58300.1 hypothetical protein DOO78_14915 [Roseicella frigidaeris]
MTDPHPGLAQEVADLHRAAFTGLVLAAVTRRGTPAAAELVFAIFRRQHHERFLPGLQKLGLAHLPHAVAAAQYHYLSNRIGGVAVDYARESDRKAWIRYTPPRWLWHGTALCGIPGEVSRAMLRGWHAQNGVSLGNPRLGFVCTGQAADGDPALEGYYLEHDRELAPEERLRFARAEASPDYDPAAMPWMEAAHWPAERLRKAHRSYAMAYLRTAIPCAIDLFGAAEAVALVGLALRQVGMQWHAPLAAAAGIAGRDPAEAAALLAAIALAQGERGVEHGADHVAQASWALMRGATELHPAAFACWNALWEGLVAAHDPRLALTVERRLDLGEGSFRWRIAPRPPIRPV